MKRTMGECLYSMKMTQLEYSLRVEDNSIVQTSILAYDVNTTSDI